MSARTSTPGPRGRHRAQGDVRVGPIASIPALLAERGIDPAGVFARLGLEARLFERPENWIPFEVLGALLETCVALTRCPHFGLLIGDRFEFDSLGALGGLMRNSPTLRDALRTAALHLELQDRGAASLTLDLGPKAALGYSLFEARTPAAAHILDGALVIQVRLLRHLCGPSWRPSVVQLSRRTPAQIAPYRQRFGANVEFDARLSAIQFERRWLDHRIEGADPATYAALLETIESHQSRRRSSLLGALRRAVHAMIFTGSVSAATLAELFNFHERTLRRRLGEEGYTVRRLVNEARRELAQHLLRDTELPVSEIAAVLGYSDASVFARAFRSWSEASPREWRAQFGPGA